VKDAAYSPTRGDGTGGHRKGVAEHWTAFARRWARLGSPVRPHEEDVSRFETIVAGSRDAAPQALLLGATPEIAEMRWPVGSTLVAVDRSMAVINSLWTPRQRRVRTSAICGQWQRLPFRDDAFDLAIGDGCLTALGTAALQNEVSRELARVLRPGGRFIQRLFVAPDVRETVAVVFDDLLAGRIGAFDVFKWRLLMATPPRSEHAVCVGDAFRYWAAANVDRGGLADASGWAPERIDTIDDYRDNETLLSFPPMTEAIARLAPFFEVTGEFTQTYELADRCPIVAMTRREA
jgi:SAM-dependent methyltransferase